MTKTKKLKLSKQLTKFQNKQHLQKPKNQGQNQNQGNNGQNQKAVLSKEEKEKERLKHSKDPYTDNERTLLIGEGNFSFALALANKFVDSTNLYASSYDTEEELEAKYGDEVKNILEQLKEMDVNLLHSIDATNLQKSKKLILKAINERKGSEYQTGEDNRRNTNVAEFDKIVFNFPHAGRGIKSQVHNIKSNQKLLLGFFKSVPQFLSESGQVLITLKSGEPYDSWKISSLATQCGFVLKECFPFNCKLYPGYEHRRTLGRLEKLVKGENDEIAHKKPKTYIFVLKGSQVQKPAKQDAGQKRKKSEDEDDDEEKDDSEVDDDNF